MTRRETFSDTEVEPCRFCQGRTAPVAFVLTLDTVVFDAQAVNRLAGTAQILGGVDAPGAMRVASALAGGPLATTMPESQRRLWVCTSCFTERLGELPGIILEET